MLPSDFPETVVEVWPENWTAVQLFIAMSTQWMPSMGGVIGLRYESLSEVRSAYGVCDSEWPDLFDAIRAMEQAALEVLRKK